MGKTFYDDGTSIKISLYHNSMNYTIANEVSGLPFNVVLFDRSTVANAREYVFVGVDIGAVVYAVNTTDNQVNDVTGIYASGKRIPLQGGMAAVFMYVGSSYWSSNESATSATGLGWVCLGIYDNGTA